jgi:hypothetical protein
MQIFDERLMHGVVFDFAVAAATGVIGIPRSTRVDLIQLETGIGNFFPCLTQLSIFTFSGLSKILSTMFSKQHMDMVIQLN